MSLDFSTLNLLQAARKPKQVNLACDLSPQQRRVLELIADGQTTDGSAMIMEVSKKTVEYHRKKLMERCGVNDVAGLTKLAIRLGLVDVNKHHVYGVS